jgi:UDP-N-acetylmuramate dehydrogenase
MIIGEHVLLAPYTAFRVGGPARYFAEVKTIHDVQAAYQFAREKGLPVFILGGGSNVLIQDEELEALVIRMTSSEIRFEGNGEYVDVVADAGVVWDTLVADVTERGLWGMENLSAIPGSVGASAVQNIGAYGVEAKDIIHSVDVYDSSKDEVHRLNILECVFGYRDSIFKHPKGKNFVVLSVHFRLQKKGTPNLLYKDFTSFAANHNITLLQPRDIRHLVTEVRAGKLPDLQAVGTVGSFFMNPVVSQAVAKGLIERFPEMPQYPQANGTVKLSAAFLIDKVAGLQGVREGDVGLWSHHALVLVNYGKATAQNIVSFASMIVTQVKEKSDVILVPEVVMCNQSSFKFHK